MSRKTFSPLFFSLISLSHFLLPTTEMTFLVLELHVLTCKSSTFKIQNETNGAIFELATSSHLPFCQTSLILF